MWLLGIIDIASKDFRLEVVLNRDELTIKSFISKNIEIGNNKVSDGCSSYVYLDNNNSGYNHIRHILGHRDFGIGIQSTLHVGSIWVQIKSKIKESYHVIPPKNFMLFVREIEYKIKKKDIQSDQKIKNFFGIYENTNNAEDMDLYDSNYILLLDDLFIDYEDVNPDEE